MREISRLLELHGLHPDPVGLFDFLQAGIELRELAKFHFTRNLSDALALIVEYGVWNWASRVRIWPTVTSRHSRNCMSQPAVPKICFYAALRRVRLGTRKRERFLCPRSSCGRKMLGV